MRILDLYCGAGAVSRGLIQAGAKVIGVDINPQPNFPGPFIQHDALTLDPRFIASFDAIWASPPCQKHTALKHAKHAKVHADLIPQTRGMLIASGLPYVIENVEGAPLRNAVMLCGSMFGLGAAGYQLRRHRLFEANFPIVEPACRHTSPVIGIYGGHVRCRSAAHGGRGTRDFIGMDKKALAMEAMGLDYDQTMDEISQAIPPAFSRYIAEQLQAHLNGGAK